MEKRNYGIDFLRVILMFFIILGHLFAHTNLRQMVPILSAKGISIWQMQTLCLCAVNCFVIITGYFMINARWKISHLLKLWSNVFVYSVIIGGSLLALGLIPLNINTLMDMFFPVLRRLWWFISAYVLLFLLIPFLNICLKKLTTAQWNYLMSILVVVFYILPLLEVFFPPYDPTEGMGIMGFVSLYVVGAYLAVRNFNLSWKWCIVALLTNNLIILSSKLVLYYITSLWSLERGTGLFYHYNTIFELLNAILLLLLFKQFSFTCLKQYVAWIAPSVFSIYLIHEHPAIRRLLWKTGLLEYLQQASCLDFMGMVIMFPVTIMILCICIDKLVQGVILGPYFRSTVFKWFERKLQEKKI